MASLKDTCGPIKIGEKLRDSQVGDQLCFTALQEKNRQRKAAENQLILKSAGNHATSRNHIILHNIALADDVDDDDKSILVQMVDIYPVGIIINDIKDNHLANESL